MKLRAKVTAWAASIGLAFGFGFIAANPAIKADEAVAKDKGDMTTLVKGNNQFAFELYGKLRESEKGNIFYSPYSISAALGMTYDGARGDTATEMAKTLHFTLEQSQVPAAFQKVQKSLNGDGKDRPFELNIANSIWGNHTPADQFKKNIEECYGGKFYFGPAPAARAAINAWVEEKTKNKIKDLIHADDINPNTELILVNAIYFKSDWLTQFNKDLTKDEEFSSDASTKVKAPMMHSNHGMRYMKTPSYAAVELPYKGKEVSMIVVLPNEAKGLEAVEKELIGSGLDTTVQGLREYSVDLSMPRFKTTARVYLNEQLKALGMAAPFDDSKADFTGIPLSKGNKITKVIHQALVEVDEKGTEAAAATAVVVGTRSVHQEPPKAIFKADHPFLFAIRDNATGSVLFLGRIVDPTTK